ncbi:MAG TPA: hypothetical protein VN578_14245 [Candidatus Binatia bacterium]|jgi:hypothetical protein|nr:hypothetical protein [Candidatus Binatia bacterium]
MHARLRKIIAAGLRTRAVVLTLLAVGVAPVEAQVADSWILFNSGKWETDTNWSFSLPDATTANFITNSGTKTITIDATTASGFPGTMMVTSITLGVSSNSLNTLRLNNAGTSTPLEVLDFLAVERGGNFTITGSSVQVDGLTSLGGPSFPGASGDGTFTLNSGSAQLADVNVGDGTNGSGVLNILGGALTVTGTLAVATMPAIFRAKVIMSGGVLSHTNSTMLVGRDGAATFVQSGGTNLAQGLQLGSGAGSQGSFALSNSLLLCTGVLRVGDETAPTAPCSFFMRNATLAVTNDSGTGALEVRKGSFTLQSGLVQADSLFVSGPNGSFTNIGGILQLTTMAQITNGTVALLGGTNEFPGGMSVGGSLGSTATVTIASSVVNISGDLILAGGTNSSATFEVIDGATLTATNGTVFIGPVGSAQMTISNATALVSDVKLGGTNAEASGDLYLFTGGELTFLSSLSANFVVVGGGDLDGSGGTVIIGQDHDAALVVSGGMATNIGTLFVGYSPGYTGTLTQSGGIVSVHTNLIVGDCVNGALGAATLSGGTLYVTNAAHDAVMDVRNGTVQLNSGAALVVDILILTNSCGHFRKQGGTLTAATIVLDPNLDADGDGQSNTNEFLAGTDPLDPASDFRIVSITQEEGTNARVTWTTVSGRSYLLQAAAYLTNGPATPFNDLSPVIVATNTGTTNLVHTNIVGSAPARFYRVRTPALLGADNASNPVYNDGDSWNTDDNGGVGFGAWALNADTSGGGSGGFFVADSSGNGSGASGNINTVGNKSWGIYANGGTMSEAVRVFNAPLGVGQVVKLDLDNGYINTAVENGGGIGAGKVGFGLRNGATDVFEFYFTGGDTEYRMHDGSGASGSTSILFTDGGLHIEFTLTGATTYSVTTTPNGGSPSTFTGTLAASGPVDTVRFFNYSAGSNSPHDAYFNSLEIGR